MRVVVKQVVMEWYQQVQSLLPDASLFAALQLSFDLHFLESSLQYYTTPAGTRLLQTCHSLIAQAVSHCLCDRDAQCRQVQQVFGDHTSSTSVAAWLSAVGKQAVEQALNRCSFSHECLVDGAAVAQAAMSAPATSSLSRLASSSSRLSPYSSGIDVPASPQHRLVINKPKSAIQSRLIGKTASSAAALAALQGKYAMPSTPRSPAIKAFRQILPQQSTSFSSFSSFSASDHHSTSSSFHSVKVPTAQQLGNKASRLRTFDSSSSSAGIACDSPTGSIPGPEDGPSNRRSIGSDSRTGSILGPKDGPSNRRSIGSDSRTGSILGPQDGPSNRRSIGSDSRTGSILGPKDGPSNRRSIGSDSRTGSILGPKDRPSNRRSIGSDSLTGSILGPKDRAGRHKPPTLQPQSSTSLNAIAAIHKLPPLQIPLQA